MQKQLNKKVIIQLTKKDLLPIEKVVNALSEQYPDTSFSFEVRNYGSDRLPDFAIYASDGWVKPCGSSHCNCGNTKQGGREKFLEEINQMLNDEVKTEKAQDIKREEMREKKRKEISRLEDELKSI